MAGAQQAQQQAEQAMRQAAQALENLGQALSADMGIQQGAPTVPPTELADAHYAVSQAAQTAMPSDAQQAAQMLSDLAGATAQRAQGMTAAAAGATGMKSGKPAGAANPRTGVGMMQTDLTAQQLRELGIDLTDWAKLPSELKESILQSSGDLAPAEYRPLVKRYLQEVAKRGSAGQTEGQK